MALLPEADFRLAVAALPLVSIDLCATDVWGRLLQGLRTNAPARGWWFTPGAWDHFYDDSAFDPAVSTHYVNLPHWLALGRDEAAALRLEADDQHSAWRWAAVGEAAADATVHPYVRAYADWIGRALGGEGGAGRSG